MGRDMVGVEVIFHFCFIISRIPMPPAVDSQSSCQRQASRIQGPLGRSNRRGTGLVEEQEIRPDCYDECRAWLGIGVAVDAAMTLQRAQDGGEVGIQDL